MQQTELISCPIWLMPWKDHEVCYEFRNVQFICTYNVTLFQAWFAWVEKLISRSGCSAFLGGPNTCEIHGARHQSLVSLKRQWQHCLIPTSAVTKPICMSDLDQADLHGNMWSCCGADDKRWHRNEQKECFSFCVGVTINPWTYMFLYCANM